MFSNTVFRPACIVSHALRRPQQCALSGRWTGQKFMDIAHALKDEAGVEARLANLSRALVLAAG
jgi:hypothetical protein